MVWVYYSAQIFLFGAEFTQVYSHAFGSRRGKQQPAAATHEAAGVPALVVAPADIAPAPAEAVPIEERPSAVLVDARTPVNVHARVLLRQKAFKAVGIAAALGLIAGAVASSKGRGNKRPLDFATASGE